MMSIVKPSLVEVEDFVCKQLTKVFSEDDALINRKLPRELLLRVFSYLDVVSLCRCAQVSNYWHILALDGSNWQRIDLFNFQTDIEGRVVENIGRRCGGFLKQLSLRGCLSVNDAALVTFAEMCNNIEELNLNLCKDITDITCAALSKHCPRLVRLHLDSCPQISDSSLKDIALGCRNLDWINISWSENITPNGIEELAQGCNKLQGFVGKGLKMLNDQALIALATHCRDLQHVNLHSCSSINDRGVIALAENCPNIRYLCLTLCSHLTDASLLVIAQNCPQLETLEVASCSLLYRFWFPGFSQVVLHILTLPIPSVTTVAIIGIWNGPMKITRLYLVSSLRKSLSHCELITDEGIRHLGVSPCSTEHLAVLELDNCPLISDASLDHLLSCHNLQRIELYDCQLITRGGIKRLKSHLPNIKVQTPTLLPNPTTNRREVSSKVLSMLRHTMRSVIKFI
ncbi:F-box/LRR-repeat protein 20 [Armadillidium vulgare]|nr:F-box/LRR-repeat protein 20 [Armadillidium vulgare]